MKAVLLVLAGLMGAAGVMLYGISLLAGLLNTAHLPTIATRLAALDIPAMVTSGENWGTLMVLALSALMIMVGLAFKLSAVPFHFWCPDVFEGASAEVDAFLSRLAHRRYPGDERCDRIPDLSSQTRPGRPDHARAGNRR